MKFINRTVFILNIILVSYTFFAYLSPFVDPSSTVFFGIMGLGFPYLVVTNIICILFWFVQKKPKKSLLSSICLVIGLPFLANIFAFNFSSNSSASQNAISFATYNMQFAKPILFKDKETAKRASKKFQTFLKSIDEIDILCLQEFNKRTNNHLQEAMTFSYKHSIEGKTVAIFSKYPILDQGVLDFGSKVNICLWADIKKNEEIIRVYAAHLQSNQAQSEPPIIVDMKTKESINTSGVVGLLRYYNKYTSMRAAQSREIRKHHDNSPYPAIICGDFNDPPQSYTYRVISKGLQDSFIEKGKGFGSTYAGRIPALRIDYILADSEFDILSHEIIEHKYSDHHIVKSQIEI